MRTGVCTCSGSGRFLRLRSLFFFTSPLASEEASASVPSPALGERRGNVGAEEPSGMAEASGAAERELFPLFGAASAVVAFSTFSAFFASFVCAVSC